MGNDILSVSGGASVAYTFLQIMPDPSGSLQQNKNLILAGIVSCASQLLIKLGNKMIARIGRKRRVRRRAINRIELTQ